MNLYSGLSPDWVVRGATPSPSSNVIVSSCVNRRISTRKHAKARRYACYATEQPVGVASLSSSVSALDSMQADDLLQEMARAVCGTWRPANVAWED
ncbi:hypothetical protein DUNSADRAFT_12307 [Dunaliella salina]|uniref:Encoded protein n=1 Tax=Dunaliella salina TaxID=3046 RepID=A0ABQ7GBL8_DUNSA|nr:hypothetical protein DUNSADRAFT_12307 [Dunaliella salina]|eukprot:KAF5831992.1 hypothetical protein DUNSADRAFT_12307 [Dunaliella salina]